MYNNTYHFEELNCKDCAMEIVEALEKYNKIKNVYIDFDEKNITIESEVELSKAQVKEIVFSVLDSNEHSLGHPNSHYLNDVHHLITEEYVFDDLCCENCANKIETELKKSENIEDAHINMYNKKIVIKHLNNVEVYNVVSRLVNKFDSETVVSKDINPYSKANSDGTYTSEFAFEDIDCANCARKVEESLNKDPNIINANVNYLNKRIKVVHKASVDAFELTKKILKKVEHDAELYLIDDKHHSHHHEHHHEHIHNNDGSITSTFSFENIDCANCASKVENMLNKADEIILAQVNYLNKKIVVTHKADVDIFSLVSKILKSEEPDAYLLGEEAEEHDHHNHNHEHSYEHEHEHNHECEDCHIKGHREIKKKINKVLTIIGGILFVIGLVLLHIGEEEITENLGFEPLISGMLYIIPLYVTFILAYAMLAYDLIYKSFYGLIHGDVFNESLLMVVASLASLSLCFFGEHEFFEACMVIILYKFGEYLQDKATDKSKDQIKALIEMRKDTVTLLDGTVKKIKDVHVGEVITIKAGEQIPLDGVLMEGSASIDMKTLTGESTPVLAKVGEEILSGSINLTKVVNIEVSKEDSDSTLSKLTKLVNEASNQKSKSEQFITKFARVYTPAAFVIAILVGLIEAIVFHYGVSEAIHAIITILVISCPCALVISIPLGYFAGIGRCSASGILVKGGNYLEALSASKNIVFDKTGTITKGNFKVYKIYPEPGYSEDELLRIVANVEQFSTHPVAKSIQEAYNKERSDNVSAVEEISGGGLKAIIDNREVLVGNDNLFNSFKINYKKNNDVGTVLYVSLDKKFIGSIVIRDEIRDESYFLFEKLRKMKYRSIMLTGDSEEVAKDVSLALSLDEYHAKMLPQDKYNKLEELIKEEKGKVTYIGDGINDTPSLTLADIGIAMGGIGSDSAKECADIVIMNDDISKLYDAIKISKFTKRIVIENIIFTLGIKVLALIAAITLVNTMFGPYLALFAIFADVGVCILAIFNSLRILAYRFKKNK